MAKTWTQRGGYSSYGRSALSAQFALSGLDEYLEKIANAGNNIDSACQKAVNASTPIIEQPMKDGAERHKHLGDVVSAIEIKPAKIEGNLIWGSVGIDFDKHPEAIHAVFQEYGDGHSPEFPDPFVRPAVDNNRREIAKVQRQILKKEGVPID